MFKKNLVKALLLVLVIVMVLLPIATADNGFKKMELRLGHTEAVDSIRERAAQYFAKRVSELTEGAITVRTFPAGQLGGIPAMTEQLQTGGLDFTCTTPGIVEPYDPEQRSGVLQLPYLFDTYEQAWAMMDDSFTTELFKPLIRNNIRFISMWESGIRHITNNVRPIYRPSDLKDLKIRVVQSKISQAIVRSLGANAVPMSFTELYTALQGNVLDGQENPLAVIYPSRFDEVQKYLSLTGHQYDPIMLVISEFTWKKLGANGQKVIQQAADEARDSMRIEVVKSEQAWLKELEAKGMKINEVDKDAFRKASEGSHKVLESHYGKDLIEQTLKKAEAIREQYPAN